MGTFYSLALINGISLPSCPPFANPSILPEKQNNKIHTVLRWGEIQETSQVANPLEEYADLRQVASVAEDRPSSREYYLPHPSHQDLSSNILTGLLFLVGQRDVRKTLILCQKAEASFIDQPVTGKASRLLIYYYYLLCLVHLSQVEDGERVARRALAMLEPTNTACIKFQELLVLLYSRTEKYEEAYVLLKGVMAGPCFDHLEAAARDRWMIYEAYLLFALSNVPASDPENSLHALLARCCQQTSGQMAFLSSSSYQLLIRVLLSIVNKDPCLIEGYSEILQKNCVVAKRKDQRWGHFMEWILEMSTAGFHSDIVNISAEKCIQALRRSHKKANKPLQYLEIISFERLWVMTLNCLS